MSGAPTTIISPEQLLRELDNPDWVIVDCRHDLADPEFGRAAYADGHLPGARFVHLDEDLSGPKDGTNGRHPLPDVAALAQRLGELGIDRTKQVIAYDDAGGMFAARLWWLLRWLGHERVAVLDGDLHAWRRHGGQLTRAPVVPSATRFEPVRQPIDAPLLDVLERYRDEHTLIVDARSPDRFRGENETIDPVGGHIPGAINRFFKDNLDADGNFKPAAQLRREFTTLLDGVTPAQVIHQCGSGVTACHNLLAMEIAGLPGGRLYPGSWSEWCASDQRPVATGP
ncbi:sulfurtransferase [Nitrogeniibacter mangrovi]|uniref:Sulfurtransferase n=1 Tax=Nitrogeniibacter mangrovi TaxID=2016596 RepID=A0A6C1B767_9RHOO|nr:sulfurtransferase [Nitrogeniibacter mangrovi]QID18665.1 sulfurtransferase [Nitrogeniibacter mangrovi]